MSIPHFLIPWYFAHHYRIDPRLIILGAYGFEFIEPRLYRAVGEKFKETQENETGDIVIGAGGAILGFLLLAVDVRAVRGVRRRRDTRGRCLS